MSYTYAWIVAVVAGLLGGLGLYALTRSVPSATLRTLLCLPPPVLMLVPAPVPGYPGNLAPAFVVAIFESLFVADGHPRAAIVILTVAFVGTALATILLGRALGGRIKEQQIALENTDN